MKVVWHRFDEEWPEDYRDLWVWDQDAHLMLIVERDTGKYGFCLELENEVYLPNYSHWAYMERPEPPEENTLDG